jgi:demethylmenaquinone methyltransferase/2-methoxy-6-polyprenyl-1,4-benzoquinol methylase
VHFTRALGWFRRCGMQELRARTLAGDARVPLSAEMRRALAALLDMRWPGVESELNAEDREAYRRLCRPTSPDFILDCPDYYAFYTYSMFWGRVPPR